ncbi:MAG: hypothetical protein HDT39_03785 [Lachnospiraceae bacterium]|nr:hypothetical protein [Lachnospiraceae bacterium]
MKIRSKTAIVFLVASSLLLIGVFVIMYFKDTGRKGPDSIYTFGTDKTTIIKYDLDNSGRRTLVLEGSERKKIIQIFHIVSDERKYDVEKFDFQYIVNFRNGYIGYIDINERMFKCGENYYGLTQNQCDKIESLFNKYGS